MQRTRGEQIFSGLNIIVLLFFSLAMLLPFLHVIAKSFSSETAVLSGHVGLLPVGFQTGTYRYVLENSQFYRSFAVSVQVTVIGTLISMLLTVTSAYPLSKTHLRGRPFLLVFYVFTMLFHGGIIPNYLLYRTLGITNTIWALIAPMGLVVFNMLIVKSFMEGLPESVEESARMDGASYARILVAIVIPMSLPVIATISLFYAVAYWNNFFFALIYITKPSLKPLQLFLYELITESRMDVQMLQEISAERAMNLTTEAILSATIVVATVPILLVYPFLQRYFVKGVVIGSVKG